MVDKIKLGKYSIEELRTLKSHVEGANSKEELLTVIEELLQEKEQVASTSMNSQFLVDWMNIDPGYRELLKNNGIETEAQLLAVKNLWSIPGMTEGGHEQISWARSFFDFTSSENLSPEETVVAIVEHAAKVGGTGTTGKIATKK